MLKNVKIGPKLIGGFAIVAILALVVGLVGVGELASIRDSSGAVTSKTVPQLVELNLFDGSVRDLRRLQAGKLLAKADKKEDLVANYTKQMDDADKSYKETKDAFEKNCPPGTAR